MQDIRMRFEMPVTGPIQSQPEQSTRIQTTIFGTQNNRPMNLYTKTNHNGVILSTSNLVAMHDSTMNNNNNSPALDNKGKVREVMDPSKSQKAGTAASEDMNSNLIKLKAIANTFVPNSPTSSEEDNSPTEMNNCRRMIDKPPLVKRLTMGLLMKTTEESRPLVHNTHNHSPGLAQMNNNVHYNNNHNNNNQNNNNNSNSSTGAPAGKGTLNCDGYVNEGICDRDRVVKFDDSGRQSLMALHHLNNNQNHEFNFKKNLLRETSSGE